MASADKKCNKSLLSYKSAFTQKSKLLDKMVKTNAKMFFELEANRENLEKIDLRINKLNKDLKKANTVKPVKTIIVVATIIAGTLIGRNNYKNWLKIN